MNGHSFFSSKIVEMTISSLEL